ncbi:hypothetical protein CEXT_736021 [Caerostris extrusa]|uniref:Uncharacterized protein n=1 Tax=Caerostris extrusa TaxID=172846 RepID=A0AAV4URI6_CAEEX|nr:hypothetical protein CEXT_736021 [Caerostris extrusa]
MHNAFSKASLNSISHEGTLSPGPIPRGKKTFSSRRAIVSVLENQFPHRNFMNLRILVTALISCQASIQDSGGIPETGFKSE